MDTVVFRSTQTIEGLEAELCKDWIVASGVHYRWEELSHTFFPFDVSPRDDDWSMGKSAGLIAIHRNLMGFGAHMPNIETYNLASEQLSSFIVSHKCDNVFHSVLINGDIAVVCGDGYGCIFSDSIEAKSFRVCDEEYIMHAAFCEEGCACLTSQGKLVWVDGYVTPRLIHTFECIGKPEFFGVIPPEKSVTGAVSVIMVSNEGALIAASKSGAYQMEFTDRLIDAAISPSCTQIALIDENYKVMVTDAVFSHVKYESNLPLEQLFDFQGITWVGEAVPIVAFDGAVALASDDNSGAMWIVNDKPVLFSEQDAAIIVTSQFSYRLSIVPDVMLNIFKESDGAKLLRCFSNRLEEPPIEALSMIDMGKAIEECLTAAKLVTKKDMQLFFLDGACFGNSFAMTSHHKMMAENIYKVKILNTLRERCSIWMTCSQLESVNLEILLKILCSQNRHVIAAKVARMFGHPVDEIGKSYVNHILETITDDELCWERLTKCGFVDFTDAALCAFRKERTRLELRFLEKGDAYSRKAIVYAERHLWENAFKFAEMSLDQSTLFTVVMKAVSDPESNQFMFDSEPCRYFCIQWPELVNNEKVLAILHCSNGKVTHAHSRFGLRRLDPPLMLDSISTVINVTKFQTSAAEAIGDTTTAKLPVNRIITMYDERGDKKSIRKMAKQCGIDMKKTYVIRLKYYAKFKKWDRFRVLARKTKCKSLWRMCMELCYAYGDETEAERFTKTIESVSPKWIESHKEEFGQDKFAQQQSFYKLFR